LEWTLGALGGLLAKVNQHLILDGRNAEAVVNGVMFTETAGTWRTIHCSTISNPSPAVISCTKGPCKITRTSFGGV